MSKKKFNQVLLVDDSNADNFLHTRLIRKAGITDTIVVKNNGREALDYLTTMVAGAYPRPDLVFLDINMPGMNGWEFLDAYQTLDEQQKAGIIICMLTTAYSDKDRAKAAEYGLVDMYIGKPLTSEKLMEVCNKYS